MLYKLPVKISSVKSKQSSGFTLIEVLVTILIVGILSAIAAPSWLGFVARQRLNKANDTVLVTLREAQREAKKTKRAYSVSFRKNPRNTDIVEYAIYPTNDLDGKEIVPNTINLWKPLGSELGINPEQFLVGTNLTDKNKGNGDTVRFLSGTKTISFDYTGTLPRDAQMPLKIVLATPKNSGNRQQQLSNIKRCVIIETFIGGIKTAIDEDCNSKNSTW